MPARNTKDRERLGRLLMQRRVELDPRYRNRRVFAGEREINYRLVMDIENSTRDNFDDAMLAFISLAYGWTADSAARVMEGGDPVPADPGREQAERVGRAVLEVLDGGGDSGEQVLPQAILDIVRAASGRKPRRRQGNGTQGALPSVPFAAN